MWELGFILISKDLRDFELLHREETHTHTHNNRYGIRRQMI